jgi:nucleoside-diphosphate-sugar epimerase
MTRCLVTGAFGQIGTELTAALRERYGNDQVWATGRRLPEGAAAEGPAELLDVTDQGAVEDALRRFGIGKVFHLAARLSAVAEEDPPGSWEINVGGLRNVLEASRNQGVQQMFWPSSIAVFGPETQRTDVPQETVMRPTTIYGIAKVTGELLCDYYVGRYGLDVRGVRYPGVISSGSLPGGGTTDYAVEIFYAALAEGRYRCFVREDTRLPMIYMPDCIKAALRLMDAPRAALRHHNAFNVSAMSFSAGELAEAIRAHLPDFTCSFEPDERQQIADSWPESVDDQAARQQWGWRPDFDLAMMTGDMLRTLGARLGARGAVHESTGGERR